MFCAQCGSGVDPGDSFCANCGASRVKTKISKTLRQNLIYGTFVALAFLLYLYGQFGISNRLLRVDTGSEFLGKWESEKNPRDSFEIVRNGEQFLLVRGDEKIPATLKDGTLEVVGPLGSLPITHIKSSDTLMVPGGHEVRRSK